MYKIYINEKPLIFVDSMGIQDEWLSDKKTLVTKYMGKTKEFLQYIDLLEKKSKINRVILHANEVKDLKNEFFKVVDVIHAGGGLVFNSENKLLVIFRRGLWDLPKGKIEKGEIKREGALREVMEETGVDGVKIQSKVGKTYHLFRSKHQKRALKLSHWYEMTTSYNGKLVPQLEEDIEKAKWVEPKDFLKNYTPMFINIRNIVTTYLASR